MLAIVRKRVLRALPLLTASLIVAIGTYFVGVSAIGDLQSSQAEFAARSFGKYLAQEVPGLRGVVTGEVTNGGPVDALSMIKPIGSVFKFRIYDQYGNLRVDSSPFAATHIVDSRNAFEDLGARAVAETGHSKFQVNNGDGRFLPLHYSEILVPLMVDGQTVGVLSVLSDESETLPELFNQFRTVALQVLALMLVAFGIPVALYLRKFAQLELTRRRLKHSARHDDLTGVLNRAGFTRALIEHFGTEEERGYSIAVQIIDLDRFKDVNETGGHALGDEVLKEVAERIRRRLGTREKLARLGADEFAILQPYWIDMPHGVGELAAEVARGLAEPMTVNGRVMQVTASIGYALAPIDGSTPEELMRAADVALNYAKVHARGRAIAFNSSMEAERQSRYRIEQRLRTALARNEFDLHFQPVFETISGKLSGFEALLRLSDDYGVPISPAEFIPVAEEVGLIGEIGRWVLMEACRLATQWPDSLFVAVNLSPAQFTVGGMADQVREALQVSALKPERLELEVTESVLITETENVLHELRAIKSLGPKLALDDFGTGYSSLSYLWRFPFDKLKVDRSFMSDVTIAGSRSREILSTIVALGRVLNLTVTAEGVETEAQAEVLRELRCDLVQGYLYGRPQRATDVAATIIKAFGVPTRVEPVPLRQRRN